jgi:hypothetical protein
MSYLARARAVRVEWDEREADRFLDAAVDRIGGACTVFAGFGTDQRRADLEEAINLAAVRRDRDAYVAALAAWEEHCLAVYRPPSPSAPTGPEAGL